jgi:hypothetical protein
MGKGVFCDGMKRWGREIRGELEVMGWGEEED